MKTTLTRVEKHAVLCIVDERIAGGTSDLADALGLDDAEAEELMAHLQSAALKLSAQINRRS